MLEDESESGEPSWPRAAEAMRREFVSTSFEELRERSQNFHYTLAGRLAEELTKDAVAKLDPNHAQRQYELQSLLEEARGLVFDLMYAATSHENDWEKRQVANFWSHNIHPGNAIKNRSYKLLQRHDVENVAERYLAGQVRSQGFDRTMVDMLLAFELYTFGDEMLHPYKTPGLPVRSPLKWPHPLWVLVRTTFFTALVLGGAGALASWAMTQDIIGDWGAWVIAGCGILWILSTGMHIVALPWVWWAWAKARKKTRDLLEAMLTTYAQMQSESVISAQHVLDNVKSSAAIGVVWPSPIYVLLEDVVRRGGRL